MTTPIADFVLPGDWWRVPLDTPETIRSSAKALATKTFGKSDEHARFRAEMSADVISAAERARTIDGQDFFFALELAPGERVPLSLTTCFPPLEQVPSRASHPRIAAEVFAGKLQPAAGTAAVEVIDLEDLGVVRVVDVKRGSPEGVEPVQPGRLTVNYWVLNVDSPRALVMSFVTPLVEAREEMLFLTEAIVSSVTWRRPADDAVPIAE